MTQIEKWKLLNSQLIINNKWCKVRQDEIELPTGEVIDDYFIYIKNDIVVTLPITQQQEIVFVRQYRHGVGEILLELPAGSCDPDEDIFAAATRELEEETGYVTEKLVKLATLYDSPVKDTNKIHLFLATNVHQSGKQKLDVTEQIEVILIPVSEVMSAISRGEVCVSGSVAAIFLGLNFLSH